MSLMNLRANTYTIAIDNTNKSATLTPQDANQSSVILTNNSTKAVFVTSGTTAPTAVFPTSATAPLQGTVVLAGAIVTMTKTPGHGFISAIQAEAGTGSLYISVGSGV